MQARYLKRSGTDGNTPEHVADLMGIIQGIAAEGRKDST
jgi:hypothetical protein